MLPFRIESAHCISAYIEYLVHVKEVFDLPSQALQIKVPYARAVVQGSKTWEIRNHNTTVRGRIGIAEIGSHLVIGSVNVVACNLILKKHFHLHVDKHNVTSLESSPAANYKTPFVWDLKSRSPVWLYFDGTPGQAVPQTAKTRRDCLPDDRREEEHDSIHRLHVADPNPAMLLSYDLSSMKTLKHKGRQLSRQFILTPSPWQVTLTSMHC